MPLLKQCAALSSSEGETTHVKATASELIAKWKAACSSAVKPVEVKASHHAVAMKPVQASSATPMAELVKAVSSSPVAGVTPKEGKQASQVRQKVVRADAAALSPLQSAAVHMLALQLAEPVSQISSLFTGLNPVLQSRLKKKLEAVVSTAARALERSVRTSTGHVDDDDAYCKHIRSWLVLLSDLELHRQNATAASVRTIPLAYALVYARYFAALQDSAATCRRKLMADSDTEDATPVVDSGTVSLLSAPLEELAATVHFK